MDVDPLIGRRLSHYDLLEKVGSGGMGVVYRARDSRLDRDVAVKLLPAGVLANEESIKRFRREVLLLSQLSHPNIATVLDFDTQGDRIFLVMEYVAGQTLASQLESGPLPIPRALAIVTQLVEALDAAHERGVIHRDVKPTNVMIGRRGLVKVLDFGLARRLEPVSEEHNSGSGTPITTMTGLTRVGQVMGTPGYMSPEQILAQEQDARTDVFAFGCVFYECLAGRRAFSGETVERTLGAVLRRDPDWSALPADLPAHLRELLRRCLKKDPGQRLSAMSDIRSALDVKKGSRRRLEAVHLRGVPSMLPSFIGRENDLLECRRHLRESRLLTLAGPGGVGKTRLALRIAEGPQGGKRAPVWFVELAPVSDSWGVAEVIAAAVDVREQRGRSLLDSVVEDLRDKPGLLVVDNCEHLLEPVAEVIGTLLQSCVKLRVLATSREALGVPGEIVHDVRALSHPKAGRRETADSIAPYESVRLFVERARQVRSEFRVTDGNAASVAEICRQLDGLPLAIELAAARTKVLSVEEICSRLGDRFRLLVAEKRTGLSQHTTLRATIQWSYGMLSGDEKRVMRSLGAFVGGWTLDSATKVCGLAGDEFAALDILNRLVDKSLVIVDRIDGRPTRYRFLETVRQFASEEMVAADEEKEVRRRHFDFFASMADEAAEGLVGADQAEWLIRLEEDHGNIVSAIRWALGQGPASDEVVRMTASLWRFWYSHGHLSLGRNLLEAALSRWEQGGWTEAKTRAFRGAGILAFYQGQYDAARSLLDKCLAGARSLGNTHEEARGLNALGGIFLEEGDYPRARDLYVQSLAMSRALVDRGGIAIALGNLGTIAKYQGDDPAARASYEECLGLMREVGDRGNTANLLFDLGALATRAGEWDVARERLLECGRLVQVLGEKRTGAYALEGVGHLAAARGTPEQAVRLYAAASRLRASIQAPLTPREEGDHGAKVDQARAMLGPSAFEREWAAGQGLAFETAIECMLEWLEGDPDGASGPIAQRPDVVKTPPESTARLLARVRKGDAGAEDLLVKQYLPILRRWAHGRLPMGSRGLVDTDDIVQMTLVQALRKVDRFEPRREGAFQGAFLGYLRQILLNQIRDEARRASRRPRQERLGRDFLDRAPSPLESMLARKTYQEYEAALAQLSDRQREAVILRAEMGFSYAEVADSIGSASENAARMMVQRAFHNLARRMKRAE